jgi:Carbohydrate family 9 binding domain-like
VLTLVVPAAQVAPPLDPAALSTTWGQAQSLPLAWDVAHARASAEATTVRVTTDGKFLYVRFEATQSEPVIAIQQSNDTVTGGSNINGGIAYSDDAVWVDLWPTGAGGFQYQFESNPHGVHNEASSENVAFAPAWESRGVSTAGGYTVTMAIPLNVIHGAHGGSWRMQFVRYQRSTGAMNVWSYDPSQTNPDDASRAGIVTLPPLAKPPLPRPRVGVYGLGEVAAASAGGSTSRMGADFSIPVTQTASVFGTLHPDYSNVELDQQSISPTVFQRTYSEVRPFFTQAASFYGFNCDVCNGFRTLLYTPGIPTPSQGYAFEGKQGNVGFTGFDAIGDQRNDSAAALTYTSDDTHWNGVFNHVTADIPGVVDDANGASLSWFNGKYLSAYVDYSKETGTLVTDPSQGEWIDGGGGWSNQHFALYGSMREVGSQFNPVDGFDSHPGIAGYALFGARDWTFAPQSFLASAGISGFLDRYQGVAYGQAQSDNAILVDFLTKSAWDLQISSGSDYWRFGTELTPISQNAGFTLTYHSGMQNNMNNFPSHGSSATPTSVSYTTGAYGDGRLDTWFRSSTMRLGNRGSLTLAVDDTAQWLNGKAPDNIQWFDSLSYSYQLDRDTSFAVGLRRVIGEPPQPNGGGNCMGTCSNVSIAIHKRFKHEEIYAAYGNPNTLVTVPQAIFKLIYYIGQKGT